MGLNMNDIQQSHAAVTELLKILLDSFNVDADETDVKVRNSSTGEVYATLNAGDEIKKAEAFIADFPANP